MAPFGPSVGGREKVDHEFSDKGIEYSISHVWRVLKDLYWTFMDAIDVY